MGTVFVARSKRLSAWGYDVGLSKHLYKVGYTEAPVKGIVARGWAGETDWALVRKQDGVEGTSEDAIIDRLAKSLRMIDPKLYPRLRDTRGIFKVAPVQVENHLLVTKAMAGEGDITSAAVKPADIAAYLIANGVG